MLSIKIPQLIRIKQLTKTSLFRLNCARSHYLQQNFPAPMMTAIKLVAFACALYFVQISRSALIKNKIKNEFESPVGKQDSLIRVRRNKEDKKRFLFIDNRSNRTVELWWVGKDKKLDEKKYFDTLLPGRYTQINTYSYHRWLAVDNSTNKLLLIGDKSVYTPPGDTPSIVIIRRPGQSEVKQIREKFIETLVVVDKTLIDLHGSSENVKRYVMTLLRLGSQIFQHPSLGVKINYVLSKIVLLHKDENEIKIKSTNGRASLTSVCNYMNKIGNSGPMKFDQKLFITRKSFGYGGYGDFQGVCTQTRSCALIHDYGFSSAFVIAHETGHILGMDDKDFGANENGFVMAAVVDSNFNKYAWSKFSAISLLRNIRNGRLDCLDNKPSRDSKDLPFLHKYPGVHFSLDKQCLFEYKPGYTSWSLSGQCGELKCRMPKPYTLFYKTAHTRVLDGTECGINKWCLSGVCQKRNESLVMPAVIHGNWSEWNPWVPCSKTCGAGIRTRMRLCDNPLPRYGGNFCVGKAIQVGVCKVKNCPNMSKKVDLCDALETKLDKNRNWGYYDEAKVDLNCTFESDMCHWTNENSTRIDQQDWELHRGRTRSSGTGPSADHTKRTSQGQYIYFESSRPSRLGNKALLSSPDLAVRQGCLSFWYHMFGQRGMGGLKVIKTSQGASKTLWTKIGNQGKTWLLEKIEVKDDHLYRISFEAEKLFRGYQSDIALDDITFTPGPCEKPGQFHTRDFRDRCSLTCKTIDGRSPKRVLLNIPAPDGIRCYDNSSLDICYQGKCRNVGCDGIVDSGMKYDSCNVCGGDGTSCKNQFNVILQSKNRGAKR